MGGSITTSGEDAYGLSAQNIGSVISVNTTGSASTAITTTGSNAYGAVAYNGATLNLKSTRISTSGAGARGISINAMSAAQTPGSLPVPNVGSTLAMTGGSRSEEHTSELQSLMRISSAVFCLKKKKN